MEAQQVLINRVIAQRLQAMAQLISQKNNCSVTLEHLIEKAVKDTYPWLFVQCECKGKNDNRV